MYAEMLSLPPRATDGSNKAVPNARWYFYAAGTKTALAAYADPDLSEEHPNPLICDNGGMCAPVYFDPMKSYRAVLRSADGKTVLADLDPVNANLGSAPFGSAPNYRETGSGAVVRPIAEKLRDAPVDVADFGTLDRTGEADMTDIFTAAYAAAAASGRPLLLPAGRFAVSFLLWDKNIDVFGQGVGQTVLVPTGDDQTVITILGDQNPYDRTQKFTVRDFGIGLEGRVRCVGMCTAYLTRTTLQRIGIKGSDFYTDDAGYDQWEATNNWGWLTQGDQYCSFQEIHIERVRLGFILQPDQVAGAGVNNIFDGLHICYVQVGAMMFDHVGYGVGINFFENFKLQVCTHCALFAKNINSTTMTGVPIEYSGYQRPTIVLEGHTIKGCSMQIDRSQMRFEAAIIPPWQLGWPDIKPALPYATIVENGSKVTFANCSAHNLLQVDDSSTCRFEGVYGNSARFVGAQLSLHKRGSYAIISAVGPLDYTRDPTMRNDAPSPLLPVLSQTADVTRTVNGESSLGVINSIAFSNAASSAGAGAATANTVTFRLSATPFAAGDQAVVSFPVMSETDTLLSVYVLGMGSATYPLKAGRWQRILVSNCLDQALAGWMTVGPAGTDAPLVHFGPLAVIKNATADQFRRMSERHCFNPNDIEGPVLRQAAAPTTGSWYAGAMVYNSNLASSVQGWRCTAAGTPGTWETVTKLVRKNANLAPSAGYALPGDASDAQVRLSDTNAVLQGRINRTAPGVIAAGTVVASAPAGFRPLTTLRSVTLTINDGGTQWEMVPAQIDAANGNLSLLKATTISAANINVNAAFAVTPPT